MKDKSSLKKMVCGCIPQYSFEEHGEGYALYFGRCDHLHGYNIANMREVDLPMMEVMISRLRMIDEKTEIKRLEELSEYVRRGIPIGMAEAIEVITYQENLKEKREQSFWNRLLRKFNIGRGAKKK